VLDFPVVLGLKSKAYEVRDSILTLIGKQVPEIEILIHYPLLL
jgi:hypothetical protein